MNTGERLISACIAALIGVALLAAWTDLTEIRGISAVAAQPAIIAMGALQPPTHANL